MAKAKQMAASGPIDGPWALPDGWRWERLSSACRPVEKGSPASRFNGSFRYTDVGGIGDGVEAKLISVTGAPSRARQFVREGDTLFSGVRVNLRRTVYAKAGMTDVASTAFSVMSPSDEVEPRYLYRWLTSDFLVKSLIPLQRGSQPPAVLDDDVRAQPIAIPPREIQRRIVARIDELFSEIDDGEAALGRAREDLGTWRKALLKAAVTGELTADWRAANPPTETGADLLARVLTDRHKKWEAEPKNKGKRYVNAARPAVNASTALPESWSVAAMPQLGDFGRGKSKHRPRNDPKLYGGPYPFIQTGVVSASRGRITRYDQTYTELGLAQSKQWPSGTMCITIAANIAKTGVLQFDACFPDSVVGLTCESGVIPEYIELVIRTLQQGLEADAPATAQKNINLETLETLAIALPPTAEQTAIVAAFEEAERSADFLRHNEIDDTATTLRQSILAAAFRGELT